ncbi:adenine deaminase [Vallitalea sp.]|jgi:adenine deaminase|uniref:adenine deaminase n=1 Tax=Vallitalea sp. TaxID=1882829 RepID=UPI0025E39B5B|nr:adenine deaminase [Vallitalea sp.]MCT4687867.1 adenine deaminase [Vallitalea sp.]
MLVDRIKAATKEVKADLVISNVKIVDVFNLDTYTSDVAIKDGYFVGIGAYKGKGELEVDGTGKTIIPGFVDGHLHIESSMVTPIQYSNAILPFGVTTIIADPHEIANVSGVDGIRYMMDMAKHVPLDVNIMLPSCVPATSLERGGAILTAKDLKPLYEEESVLGLAEVMDFPAVVSCNEDMIEKLEDAKNKNCIIDGHCAGFDINKLNAYATAGIRTDHESTTAEDLIERNRRGIHTLVRYGSVCKDLPNIIPSVNERNHRLLCFATDDKHLDELVTIGGVNHNVKLAIKSGLDPIIAISMATYNTCQCYKLHEKGAIAPGYIADFSVLDNIQDLNIIDVYKNGKLVVKDKKLIDEVSTIICEKPEKLIASINIPEIKKEDLIIDMKGYHKANIIEVINNGVVTKKSIEKVITNDRGHFQPDIEKDQQKIIVIERHRKTGNIGKGILKGLKLESGAIATTISHDSHNLIVVGTNDNDILKAIKVIEEMQGGIVVVDDNKVLAKLNLEICGLITTRDSETVLKDLGKLNEMIKIIAPKVDINPLLTLSFMSLVVIPEIKVCEKGLFDFSTFEFINIYAEE